MIWNALQDQDSIAEMIDQLVSEDSELRVLIQGRKNAFESRIVKFEHGEALSKIGKKPELIIEKLVPNKGNALIQSSTDLVLEFTVNENLCRCPVKYLGTSSDYPYFGFILSFPETMEIKEKRREERFTYGAPDFVSVEFKLKKGSKKEKVYALNVLNCSRHGLGILITEKDFDLIDRLNPGDRLRDIIFYAESSMIKVDGIVRHVTKMSSGAYQGSYVLGIESREIIENCPFKQE
ncbi:MAG: hypothetical protein PVG99_14025 [Desulfobacteraceae bacterium]|jgi:hypothetical protein